ncbi:PREDICTED: uncharacterized protein LOC104592853 [Nelumbo nucifera]|uniref:Uncharacterized protein n=2 Tax=Nelumbo nucifera TaxID=4432 RepID=A0A822YQ41_NELNU|nr:PREDICTED: uncharacterized protein LOC104592853 [Nelumbo nucifera]DAD34213.1 TPA_asm: hypothetical protein HUJ06_004853 [Nelumbo nucifera]
MESNRRRKGFIKLVNPFYRTPKSSPSVHSSSKVKPSPTPMTSFVVDKDVTMPPQKQKVSFVKSAAVDGHHRDSSGGPNTHSAMVVTGEDNVDIRASTYISYVQERFRLEQVDSGWRKYQETH